MIRLDGTSVGGSGGGGGTPGGSTTQVQYNNNGAFGGASVTVVTGGIAFPYGIPMGTSPITMTGGDDGSGDSAVVIDNAVDEYVVLDFPHYVDHLMEAGGGFYVNDYSGAFLIFNPSDISQGSSIDLVGGDSPDTMNAGAAIHFDPATNSIAGRLQLIGSSIYALTPLLDLQGDLGIINGGAIQTPQAGSAFMIRAWDTDDGAWRTFVTVTGASSPSLVISPPAVGTTVDIYATTLAAAGDGGGVATTTMITNAVNSTVTNAYIVKGGQAATTANTGWTKIYIGTNAAWVPYWQNATP